MGKNNEPINQQGLDKDFPLLYEMAFEYDFAERMGGCTSPLHAEIDSALREIHMARTNLAVAAGDEPEYLTKKQLRASDCAPTHCPECHRDITKWGEFHKLGCRVSQYVAQCSLWGRAK